jgi:chromosome segregation ATPase
MSKPGPDEEEDDEPAEQLATFNREIDDWVNEVRDADVRARLLEAKIQAAELI